MATPQRKEALYKEGRPTLALQAYRQGQFQNVAAAAASYDVLQLTFRSRIAGIKPELREA